MTLRNAFEDLAVKTQLPASLGPKASAESLSVAPASDAPWLTDAELRDSPVPVVPDVSLAAGAVDATTQRMTLASNDPAVSALANLGNQFNSPAPADGSGNYMVIAALKRVLLNGASLLSFQAAGNNLLGLIDSDIGTPMDAVATSDTGAFSLNALVKRGLQNWTTLLGRIPALGQALMGASVPVAIASNQSAIPITLDGVTPTIGNPGSQDPALPVAQRPVDIWTASFASVGVFSEALNSKFALRRVGTGVTANQAGGNLVVTSGTAANAEFLTRSIESFNGAFIHRARITLSQRIVNNNFAVMLADSIGEGLAYTINSATSVTVTKTAHGFTAGNVGQFMCLGAITGAAGVPGRYAIASVPTADTITFTVASWPATGTGTLDLFGWNYYRSLYTGTQPVNVSVDAQRQGWANGDFPATINSTSAPGHVLQVAADGRQASWSDTLTTPSTTPTVTTRASRVDNLPDPDVELFVYLWAYNGTGAPASGTTWTVGFVSVEDTVNNPVYIAGMRPTGAASPLGVAIANIPTILLGTGSNVIGAVIGQPFGVTDTSAALAANATFTGTGRGSTNVSTRFVAHAMADQAGWLYIDRSTDTGATWRVVAGVDLATVVGTTSFAAPLSVDLVGVAGAALQHRVRFVNGATAQTTFQLSSAYLTN